MRHSLRSALLSALLLTTIALPLTAAESERPWSDKAELSLIATSGNSQTENLAFGNEFTYEWDKASLKVNAGALRTNTTTRIITNEAAGLVVDEISETTAENYFFDATYRHDITDTFYWYGGVGWQRNVFAGIDSRTRGFGGVGFVIFENDVHAFHIESGADYTKEDQTSGTNSSYAGARAFFDYDRKLSETAHFDTSLEILENLDDTEDLRAIWIGAVTASLSSKLALKASYTVSFDNQPVLLTISGDPLAVPPIPDRVFEFDEVDTVFAASLVVNF